MHQAKNRFCIRELNKFLSIYTLQGMIMPRITVTLPKDLYERVEAYSANNDDSLSNTIVKMTELGLLVTESQKKKEQGKSFSDIEEHCYKLMIQMNAIVKNLAAKQLEYTQEEFDKLRDSTVLKYNELIGIMPEEL